jgi:hypothetical protein
MTALDRALSWFLEPPSQAPSARGDVSSRLDDTRELAPTTAGDACASGAMGAAPRAPLPDAPARTPWLRRLAGSARFAAVDRPAASRREICCAAVLGRPGRAEPIAAAIALALIRRAPTRAATVAVLGAAEDAGSVRPSGGATRPPSGSEVAGSVRPSGGSARPPSGVEVAGPVRLSVGAAWPPSGVEAAGPVRPSGGAARPPSGGTRAARRLAARLDAHGLAAHPRGRLAWVAVPREGLEVAARRVALVGAPAVLAVTAPRTAEIEELLAEQDLLVLVVDDPDGPLARVGALAPGGVPIVVTRALARGPARSLAQRGLWTPQAMREMVAGTALARDSA